MYNYIKKSLRALEQFKHTQEEIVVCLESLFYPFMPRRKVVFLALTVFLFSSSCKQNVLHQSIENDSTIPEQVTNVRVENLPGGAKISYTISEDKDLLYVKADYEIRSNIKEQVTSSYYNNSLVINGFGDTSEREVKLFSVDRSGNQSEPLIVKVNPLASPVQLAYDSLSYTPTFGGILVHLKNEAKGDLVTTVIIKDSTGEWEEYDKNYSSLPDIDFSIRGLPSIPTGFGVFINDRWDNHSDTLFRELTPYFEEKLDKSKFKEMHFPHEAENTWTLDRLWNDDITQLSGWHSTGSAGTPVWFSFDLGVKAKLSRMKTWGLSGYRAYSSADVKKFEIWGSNNPDPGGSFNGWTKLADFEVKKPSGLPIGELSDEDKQQRISGDESIFPSSAPPMQYIRLKIISTFTTPPNSDAGTSWMVELSFWGQVVD